MQALMILLFEKYSQMAHSWGKYRRSLEGSFKQLFWNFNCLLDVIRIQQI